MSYTEYGVLSSFSAGTYFRVKSDVFNKCLDTNLTNMGNLYPLEVVGRGSETQLQVGEYFNYLI